jgi:hypothetical protein
LISRRDVNAKTRKCGVVPFEGLYACFVVAECHANRVSEMLVEISRSFAIQNQKTKRP